MQFLPKGAMKNVVPIYAYAKTPSEDLIKVGSAWRRRRQMTMRIDIYRNTMDSFATYRTADGQVFMPLVIPLDAFANLGFSEMGMGFDGIDVDEVDKVLLVGYLRRQDPNFKVSMNMEILVEHMSANRYGKSMFAVVPMNTIEGIMNGTRAVGAVSMRADPSVRSNGMGTPFLINRDLVRFM